MKKIFLFFICSLTVFLLFPTLGHAVEFTINDVKIDAYLQEKGQVEVKELHTYTFEGSFNGITREIVPKEGTSITHVQASENNVSLPIDQDDDLYKIHRKGTDETITIELTYFIENGVHVYDDVAEFYWPFFDDRNETPYEQMTIVVHPPKKTEDVIAFGYDEAFTTEKIKADGSVVYQLGEVPDDKNGDIRVAYDATLFPVASIDSSQTMRDELIKAEQKLYEKAATRAERQETLSSIAWVFLPILGILFLLLLVMVILKARTKKLDVERQIQQSFFVPKETLSLPATIYFTRGQIPPEVTGAALLDLVRKGIVSQTKDNQFRLNSTSTEMLEHEKKLTDFLFTKVGNEGEFSFADLQTYTNNKKNHETYHTNMTQWKQSVMREVKDKEFYEKAGIIRWTLVTCSILLLPFLFLFPVYGLLGPSFATVILFTSFLVFALAYHPKSIQGLMIVHEWNYMKKQIPDISMNEWSELTNDEQMRVYLYGIGMNDQVIIKKNEDLIQAFTHDKEAYDSTALNINTMILLGPVTSTSFHSAHQTTESTVSSTTTTTGGGAGGGGGGSGAF